MKAIHKKRLLKLAAHLESGKLTHTRFDFSTYGRTEGCGTAGCAIGECPVVFPRSWVYKDPQAKRFPEPVVVAEDAQVARRAFFGLDTFEFEHLFVPNFQVPLDFGGKPLDESATPEQVAANIRAFIKHLDKRAA